MRDHRAWHPPCSPRADVEVDRSTCREGGPLRKKLAIAIVTIGVVLGATPLLQAQFGFRAKDPGPRKGPAGAGGPVSGLTGSEPEMFTAGRAEFVEEEAVDDGVGPRFNFVSCAGCHAEPAVGGSSPAVNPLY